MLIAFTTFLCRHLFLMGYTSNAAQLKCILISFSAESCFVQDCTLLFQIHKWLFHWNVQVIEVCLFPQWPFLIWYSYRTEVGELSVLEVLTGATTYCSLLLLPESQPLFPPSVSNHLLLACDGNKLYRNVLLPRKSPNKHSLVLNWSFEVIFWLYNPFFIQSFIPCKLLKQMYSSRCVPAKPFITLMQSIYTKEGYWNSVKHAGVDTKSNPALPQVVAGGPIDKAALPHPVPREHAASASWLW